MLGLILDRRLDAWIEMVGVSSSLSLVNVVMFAERLPISTFEDLAALSGKNSCTLGEWIDI